MDARREPQPNVHHLARLATPQTRGFAATLRANADLRCSPRSKTRGGVITVSGLRQRDALKSVLAQGWIIHG